jgi:sugar/nucleoside kinase (ribokinase family)
VSSADAARAKHVVCTGIAVLDQVFRVPRFPRPDVKTQASEFSTINGGNAANAAVAVAHLGARATFVGPLGGPPGTDLVGDTFLALAAKENVDCFACPRVAGLPSSISAICIDPHGERAIANFRDERLSEVRPENAAALVADADVVLADNRFPAFVRDVLVAARDRGIPSVLDADEPRHDSDELLSIASHVVFSAEGLRATAGTDSLGRALLDVSKRTASFLAVTDGRNDVLWLEGGELRQYPAFTVEVVDTLGAGDTFHGAFALMLAEGVDTRTAMRFAAAAAALKCANRARPGILGAPSRAEVEEFLAKNP